MKFYNAVQCKAYTVLFITTINLSQWKISPFLRFFFVASCEIVWSYNSIIRECVAIELPILARAFYTFNKYLQISFHHQKIQRNWRYQVFHPLDTYMYT